MKAKIIMLETTERTDLRLSNENKLSINEALPDAYTATAA